MSARSDSFEGLHVLLVTEDEARAQAIAKSLRERKAHVGDVRAGARDPVALRGADLLVIDARRSSAIDTRVAEVRSDVRARWASVATIDYATLVGSEGTVDLRALEGVVSRLAGMDKALTERARKEERFETALAPLGPTRTLRALALAGPTLHVTLSDGTLDARVDLADELLVSAFAERRGERWEAWSALAHVIGMTDANVVVLRKTNATAMNIMEPVDQALENAAQERARNPEQFMEQAEELSGLRGERRSEPVRAARGAGSIAPLPPRARTLVGVPAPSSPAPAQSEAPARPWVPAARTTPPPAPASAAAPPNPLRAPPTPRDAFPDKPTDPAAPGLLQRMAQSPANDAAIEIKKVPSQPLLSVERRTREEEDDDFAGDSQEYDVGEVTVVADASQLDILRQTLDQLAEPEAPNEPLTSTMPAPKGPTASSDELEFEQVLRSAKASSPNMETSSSYPPAAPTMPAADAREAPRAVASTSAAGSAAPQAVTSAPRAPRLDIPTQSVRPSRTGKRALILVALLIAAAAAVGWLYSKQAQKQQRALPPVTAPHQ